MKKILVEEDGRLRSIKLVYDILGKIDKTR